MQMKKQSMQILMLLLLVVWLAGCATTMNDVIRSKEEGRGTSIVYPVNANQAWEIAKNVFRAEGSDAIEEHRNEGYMLTSSESNLVSYGAVMGAWVEPVDKGSTKVTVVTKRRLPTDLSTTLTETTFHKRFAEAVETIKKGDRLASKPSTNETQAIPPEKPVTSTRSVAITPPSATPIVTVTWTFASIRSGAGNDYSLVATVNQGDKLTVIGELGDWLNVRLENRKEGWISNRVVK
jgi:hypothetical protein